MNALRFTACHRVKLELFCKGRAVSCNKPMYERTFSDRLYERTFSDMWSFYDAETSFGCTERVGPMLVFQRLVYSIILRFLINYAVDSRVSIIMVYSVKEQWKL